MLKELSFVLILTGFWFVEVIAPAAYKWKYRWIIPILSWISEIFIYSIEALFLALCFIYLFIREGREINGVYCLKYSYNCEDNKVKRRNELAKIDSCLLIVMPFHLSHFCYIRLRYQFTYKTDSSGSWIYWKLKMSLTSTLKYYYLMQNVVLHM